jgi:hypothetical protein
MTPEWKRNLVSILRDTTISDHEKIALCKQVIDAFTQCGHFDPSEYYAPPQEPEKR